MCEFVMKEWIEKRRTDVTSAPDTPLSHTLLPSLSKPPVSVIAPFILFQFHRHQSATCSSPLHHALPLTFNLSSFLSFIRRFLLSSIIHYILLSFDAFQQHDQQPCIEKVWSYMDRDQSVISKFFVTVCALLFFFLPFFCLFCLSHLSPFSRLSLAFLSPVSYFSAAFHFFFF